MKRNILIAITCFIFLTACKSSKNIPLPELDRIEDIGISLNVMDSIYTIKDRDKISLLLDEIKENSNKTKKKSINDEPTNIEIYTLIQFNSKEPEENPTTLYLYKEDDKYYIEKPYEGIWELDEEIYDNIYNLNFNKK